MGSEIDGQKITGLNSFVSLLDYSMGLQLRESYNGLTHEKKLFVLEKCYKRKIFALGGIVQMAQRLAFRVNNFNIMVRSNKIIFIE